jgi:hypothetical protein
MIVLHPNTEQYNALNGYTNGACRLEFVKDGAGKWFMTLDALTYEPFQPIYDQLNELERIEYTPFPETE